jgi:hypothetical protein
MDATSPSSFVYFLENVICFSNSSTRHVSKYVHGLSTSSTLQLGGRYFVSRSVTDAEENSSGQKWVLVCVCAVADFTLVLHILTLKMAVF